MNQWWLTYFFHIHDDVVTQAFMFSFIMAWTNCWTMQLPVMWATIILMSSICNGCSDVFLPNGQQATKTVTKKSGPRFNIKMSSYQYRKSHCGDKTVVRSSYLHNGISYTGKMSSLYWIRAQMSFGITQYGQVTVIVPAYGHQVRCIPWVQMGTFNKEIVFLCGLRFFALNIFCVECLQSNLHLMLQIWWKPLLWKMCQ